MKTTVLVVDDSAFMRRAIGQMLASDPAISVAGAARNGREALDMAQRLRPDVITLDIEMPEMDGLTALTRIMSRCPTQVIMLSSLTTEGSHAALRALNLGAADVMAKDVSQVSLNITSIRDELVAKVKALGQRRPRTASLPAHASAQPPLPALRAAQFDVICIGSSTGGPPVLERIITALPRTLGVPIVIAQHMPEVFTASMAQRLGELSKLRVVHAEHLMALERHTVYVAPGGRQTHVARAGLARWRLDVTSGSPEALYRPSVDVLIESAALATGGRALGIILTGMGSDGALGARVLRDRGGTLLAQSEQSCVVYGMPKAVTEQGLIAASLAPDEIAQTLMSLASRAAASSEHAA